ncbi:membrane-associated guanylate kinase, WW and PDZ domain-containing protein 3 isoform X3 [Oryzias latipes]
MTAETHRLTTSASSVAMSKATAKKLHWRSKVQETFVPLGGGSSGGSGELGLAIGGGADYGEFPFVTAAPGGGATVGDIILEIGGTPVLGLTLGDVRGVLNSCPHPIRIKTVSPGSSLCKDLRLYLSKCFTPGCMDSQLQQLIRENLYLRAVPCTTRQPRDGEISGVDYNFVSIEEFFSLEESGALLESGKFQGNYYGTPRPVHISPESPPIKYQEHRNLLRNFRTRSKSLSNLEKAVEEDSEEDGGLSGLAGAPPTTLPLSQSWESAAGSRVGVKNGGGGRARGGAPLPKNWEVAYSDSGELYYINHVTKMKSWVDPRVQSKETASCSKLPDFTEQPSLLRGYSIHTRLSKGPRGFGFNIVGGSRPQEFLQVYSVTPGGPPALNTADILVYINDTCVLGRSHKEVVEMLKAVPMGQSVDVVLRRGYPMLYNPDGCPKQSLEMQVQTPSEPSDASRGPTHLTYSCTLDANDGMAGAVHNPVSFAPLMANGLTEPVTLVSSEPALCPPLLPERTPPNHSDFEGGPSNTGTRRSSLVSYNSNTLPALPSSSRLLHQSSKSSDSDLSTSTLPITSSSSHILSRLPLNLPETSAAQNSTNSTTSNNYLSSSTTPVQHLPMPMTFPVLNSPKDAPPCGFNGCPASHQAASLTSRGNIGLIPPLVTGSTSSGLVGELVPVAVGQSESGALGFTLTTGGQGGQQVVVKRVWDRRQCLSLQTGDIIVKINGADVQSLSFLQVQRVLQEHIKQGEVVLLVYRGGPVSSLVVTPNLYKSQPSSNILTTPSSSHGPSSPDLPFPSAGALLEGVPLLNLAGLVPEGQPKDYHPATGTHQGAPPAHSPNGPPPSSLIQSTSFLDSVPVTLTLEPCDLLKGEGFAGDPPPTRGGEAIAAKEGKEGAGPKPVEVELHRRHGEGFGFVISSQEVSKGPSLMSHRFVTVRRGSPAARCGQIQPGDQLEEVEGRPVSGLHHRDLAQILRRAGNTLRLSVTPRQRAPPSERMEFDTDGSLNKGSNQRSKEKSRFYSVVLERGPTGFGFSLRGGSEYNMGLYVLGLMDGGPAQRSNKIKVSDQLVEINSENTAGMTHSQAVEQIRRGGNRIRLVLQKGNGYVPDYDPETGALSLPSPSSFNKEQPVASMTIASLSQQPRSVGGERGETAREMETNRRIRGRRVELGAPALDLDHVEKEMMRKEEAEKKRHQEERREMKKKEERKNVRLNRQEDQEERSFPMHRVPSLGSRQMVESSGSGARERRRSEARSRRRGDEEVNTAVSHHSSSRHAGSLGGAQQAVFSFLMPMKDLSDSESACSFSEVSLSTASIATWRTQNNDQRREESLERQGNLPGPWLKPNAQKLTKVRSGSRPARRGLTAGLSF